MLSLLLLMDSVNATMQMFGNLQNFHVTLLKIILILIDFNIQVVN